MSTGYKLVHILESILAILIGAIPLMLFGGTFITISLFVCTFVLMCAHLLRVVIKKQKPSSPGYSSLCPYKTEKPNDRQHYNTK